MAGWVNEVVADLGALGINNMITAVSEFSAQVDVRTLRTLIVLAQKAQPGPPMCVDCGFSMCVRIYRDTNGEPVAYCFECKPEDVTEFGEAGK